MRRRNLVIGACAAVAALGLAAALVAVLPGQGAPPGSAPAGSPRLLSPFTGEPVQALGPVLAVKIDNLAPARPQTGLTGADIVYVLPVEGGLSRFLAVFSSHSPPVIGPVRSAREDDLELLRQFGRPARARRATSGSGSARRRPAGGRRRLSRCPTRRPRSRSAGRPGTDGGWSRWTARPRARPKAAR